MEVVAATGIRFISVLHYLSCSTILYMPSTIQARLDKSAQSDLAALTRELGWTPSRIVREGLRLLAACRLGKGQRKIIGQGKFASGISDLGSNKEHLKDFGR
jgi:hypothetical protein